MSWRSWRESIENLKSVILIRGARDVCDLTAWIVAGTLVYYLDIVPAQQRKQQLKEKAARDACDPNRYIEKCKPIPDPQVTGLIYGNKTRVRSNNKPKQQ